jgi:hypothetical protein
VAIPASESSLGASEVIPDMAEKMTVATLPNANLDSTSFDINGNVGNVDKY